MSARQRFNQKGVINLLALLGLAVALIAIPLTTRLVQERQKVATEAGGACNAIGDACSDDYPESCTVNGQPGTKTCHKRGTCTCIGGGSCCSWGSGSRCDSCQPNQPPSQPTVPVQPPPDSCNTSECSSHGGTCSYSCPVEKRLANFNCSTECDVSYCCLPGSVPRPSPIQPPSATCSEIGGYCRHTNWCDETGETDRGTRDCDDGRCCTFEAPPPQPACLENGSECHDGRECCSSYCNLYEEDLGRCAPRPTSTPTATSTPISTPTSTPTSACGFYDGQSCEWECSGSCIQQGDNCWICQPLPTATPTSTPTPTPTAFVPASECSPGDKHCEGSVLYVCTCEDIASLRDCVWNRQPCTFGCRYNSCCGEKNQACCHGNACQSDLKCTDGLCKVSLVLTPTPTLTPVPTVPTATLVPVTPTPTPSPQPGYRCSGSLLLDGGNIVDECEYGCNPQATSCNPIPPSLDCGGVPEGGKRCSPDGYNIQTCQQGRWINEKRCSERCEGASCIEAVLPPQVTIEPSVPFGGTTVGYEIPAVGTTYEEPYGFDPFQSCDPSDPTCQGEFDPLLAAAAGAPVIGAAIGAAAVAVPAVVEAIVPYAIQAGLIAGPQLTAASIPVAKISTGLLAVGLAGQVTASTYREITGESPDIINQIDYYSDIAGQAGAVGAGAASTMYYGGQLLETTADLYYTSEPVREFRGTAVTQSTQPGLEAEEIFQEEMRNLGLEMKFKSEGYVVGYSGETKFAASIEPHQFYEGFEYPPAVNIVAVDPEMRRQGIGTAMVKAWEQMMEKKGYETLAITRVNDSVCAQRFWQKMGYAYNPLFDPSLGRDPRSIWVKTLP